MVVARFYVDEKAANVKLLMNNEDVLILPHSDKELTGPLYMTKKRPGRCSYAIGERAGHCCQYVGYFDALKLLNYNGNIPPLLWFAS